VGVRALADNSTGDFNNAHGRISLNNNTTGNQNNAMGDRSLRDNTTGSSNTALGDDTLLLNTTNDRHVCVGDNAGNGITSVNNNIIIGHHSGVHSRFGQISDRCFIDNIYGAPVNNMGAVARLVYVDPDGRLGTVLLAAGAPDAGGFYDQPAQREAPVSKDDRSAMRKVEKLQKQIERLTEQLKEQAAQIQKVSAQLEASKPAPKVVSSK
jgi:carbonic anhydrase/acetyltransferase-like protein (isoleucine patch superfamily)